jgi:hypothetical protein
MELETIGLLGIGVNFLPLLLVAFGIFGSVGEFFMGEDPSLQTPFFGAAPAFPRQAEADRFLRRQRAIATDPFSSPAFRTGSAGIRDAGSVARRSVLEAIDESFGSQGGPGLESGAAIKAKAAEAGKVGASVVAQERNFLNQLLERADRGVLGMLDILGRYRASTFASETQTAMDPGTSGFFDFADEAAGVAGSFFGVTQPGGGRAGGLFA